MLYAQTPYSIWLVDMHYIYNLSTYLFITDVPHGIKNLNLRALTKEYFRKYFYRVNVLSNCEHGQTGKQLDKQIRFNMQKFKLIEKRIKENTEYSMYMYLSKTAQIFLSESCRENMPFYFVMQ